MTANTKTVFYLNQLMSPEYARIIATRPDVRLRGLRDDQPEAEALPVLETVHGYQISAARDETPLRWRGTAALIAQAPNLLVISSGGAGYDTIDVEDCTRAGVLAVNQAGGNREGVAEHVLGFMLTLAKRIAETDHFMRREADIPREQFKGHELFGRTIGIIGLGHIGTRVAELCRGLFRMRVLAFDPYLPAAEIAARGAEKLDRDAVLAQAQYISVNCPLTAETRGTMGAREFALMQPGTIYINTARGFIHDEAALADALRRGHLAGAGLDVWDREPPPPDHPLLAFDNVLASPHTGGVTVESRDNIGRIAAEQMLDILDGRRPPRLLNPEVWVAWRGRFRAIMGHDAEE